MITQRLKEMPWESLNNRLMSTKGHTGRKALKNTVDKYLARYCQPAPMAK